MLIIKTNYNTYEYNEKQIKFTSRACKGVSLRNVLKFKKDEVIAKIEYK